jgi:uncharacterized membrane protein YphA (DoxX/SURF4 family)
VKLSVAARHANISIWADRQEKGGTSDVLYLQLIARVALAVVFATAAVGKLSARAGAAGLVDRFGLGRLLAPAAYALPWVELALAAALVAVPRWAAVAAGVLLLIFSTFLFRNLRRGAAVGCNCFGSFGGWEARARRWVAWPLLRNSVLLLASVMVALPQRRAPFGELWAGSLWDALAFTGLGALGFAGAGYAFARHGRSTPRPAPALLGRPVTLLDGQLLTLGGLAGEAEVLLVFLSAHCGPCRLVAPSLRSRLGLGDEPGTGPSVVAIVQGGEQDARELLVEAGRGRVVLDDGSLAGACGVAATPAAVALRGGKVGPVVTGAEAVMSALGRAAAAPLSRLGVAGKTGAGLALAGGGFTRRKALRAAMVSVAGLVLAPWGAVGRPREAARPGLVGLGPQAASVGCPTCGSCSVCQVPAPAATSPSCRPCAKACSAHKLCTAYANENASYRKLAAYLKSQGYLQHGQPAAGGLEDGKELVYLGLVTTFQNSYASTNPGAVLIYGLTNAGESAFLALLDAKGKVTVVGTAEPSGQLVGAVVPAEPPVPTPPATGELSPAGAVLEVATCQKTCKTMWDVVLFAITPLLEGELLTPAGWALALGSFLMDEIVLSPLQDQVVKLGMLGRVVNFAIDKGRGKTSIDKLEDHLGDMLCSDFVCKLQLRACCNYTGACYDSDALCESKCPGSLKHPMAHCDVYINGIKVSTLVP